MPETTQFTKITTGIKSQFATITPHYIQGKINEMENLIRLGHFVPLFIKKQIIKAVGNNATAGCSTGFSNLGLLKLPKEIQDKINYCSFALGPESQMPYLFACVATHETLTLTTTTHAKNTALIKQIGNALRQ